MKTILVLICFSATLSAQIFGPATRLRRGAGEPSVGDCASASDVGKVWVRTDQGSTDTPLRNCSKTGSSPDTFAWVSGGGGSTGATGPTGPAGATGPTGATGANGSGFIDCSETSGTITCPNGFAAGATGAGSVEMKEASANGTDPITLKAPDSVTTAQTLLFPGAANAANQTLRFGAPSSNISTGSWALPLWLNGTNANGYFDWTLGSAPGNPTAGDIRLYPKTGSTLCARDSAGTETCYGAGSGGGVQRVAYSSLPTCDGALTNVDVRITDGFATAHCNGTSYQWFHSDLPITPPGAYSGWTAVNSPSSGSGDSKGFIFLKAAAAAGENVRSILKSVSGDWVVTGAWLVGHSGFEFNMCGLAIAEGTGTDDILIFGNDNTATTNSNQRLIGHYYTNYTTLNASTVLHATQIPGAWRNPRYVRISKSGTDWTYSVSTDGQNFITLKTETQRFTAAYAGFACNARGATGDAAMTILHYASQ